MSSREGAMTHTADDLHKRHRRLSRVTAEAHRALATMRHQGATLHRTFGASGGGALSSGQRVSAAAAAQIINCQSVVGVGDGLLPEFSQTYRLIEEESPAT